MADIFFSYAREDRRVVELLAGALQRGGWSVWWDREIPAGRTFDEVIEEALSAARCVIVLWSARSVRSRYVQSEADEGANRNILIPVLLESAESIRIPFALRRIQAADLTGWNGNTAAPAYERLVGDVARLLGGVPHRSTSESREGIASGTNQASVQGYLVPSRTEPEQPSEEVRADWDFPPTDEDLRQETAELSRGEAMDVRGFESTSPALVGLLVLVAMIGVAVVGFLLLR